MTVKQADCVYSKYKNEEIVGTHQVFECEWNNDRKDGFMFNHYEYAILHEIELCRVHSESTEIDKWSFLSTKLDYVEYNRKAIPPNRVKLGSTEGRYLKGYIHIKEEGTS